MNSYQLDDMVRGWFVGAFTPSLFSTNEVEVAVQHFKAGDVEKKHFHKIATEITVIVSGKARMNGIEYAAGSIIKISPGESTNFEAIEDTVTTVVKLPGALNDKYLVEE
ncbi:hypothetical protein [Serratia proteamaculans]